MLKRTPLYDVHRAAGAKLVDFGGWEMPLHYGSQLEEHRAVRRDAGVFDVSHMLAVDIAGPQARELLRVALANDVAKLATGKALYACMLNARGGVLDDLIVYRRGDDDHRAVVNAATADKDLAWLERVSRERALRVHLAPRRDLALVAVQGPNARRRAADALPAISGATALAPFTAAPFATSLGECYVARTGYTGEDGFEIMVPASGAHDLWRALVAAGVRPCGLGARDTLRLEAGMNLYGQDMDERVTPLESGLAWTVDTKDASRDFIGRAALREALPSRSLVGLVLEEAGGVLRAHQAVDTPAGDGETTSGTFSPTLSKSIALARVPATVAPGDAVRVRIRDKSLAARVVKPPFVRNGRSLVS